MPKLARFATREGFGWRTVGPLSCRLTIFGFVLFAMGWIMPHSYLERRKQRVQLISDIAHLRCCAIDSRSDLAPVVWRIAA